MIQEWVVWALVGAFAFGGVVGNLMAVQLTAERNEIQKDNEWQNGFQYGYARGREGYNIITGEIENGQ